VSEEVVEKLRSMMSSMKSWERRVLLRSGRIVVEIVKLPERKGKTSTRPEHLALMIRREDAFRGLIIVSPEELDDLRKAISAQKLDEVVAGIWRLYREKSVQEFEL